MNTRLWPRVLLLAIAVILTVVPVAWAADKPVGTPNAEKLGWRLGCQAYSFNKFTFFEAVDKTASVGLKYIEAYPGQKLSAEMPDAKFDQNMSEDAQKAVKAKLDAAGVKLVNYGVVGLPNDEKECRKVFDFAKKMGVETIVSEPSKETLSLLDKLTEEYGINVAIHNHPKPSPYWDYKIELEALQGHSKRIGACADTGHWMRSCTDSAETVKKLKEQYGPDAESHMHFLNSLDGIKALDGRIVSLHLKDLDSVGKLAHDVPYGTGKTDIKGILAELKRQGFKGVFSIEYEYNMENSLPEIAKCVANFEAMAAELAK